MYSVLISDIKYSVLPASSEIDPPVGASVTITGWGKTEDGIYPDHMMYSDAPVVIDNSDCGLVYGSSVTSGSICVQDDESGTCNGDSGGPLNWPQEDGSYIQVGITSFGPALGCETGLPHVFTRVSQYIDYIESVVDA